MTERRASRVLFRLDDLANPDAREAVVDRGGKRQAVFVVRRGDVVRGYVNRCPHRGVPLNWQPDVFLAPDGTAIQCAMHGARFRIDDGRCESGPCPGHFLEPISVAVEDGLVILYET